MTTQSTQQIAGVSVPDSPLIAGAIKYAQVVVLVLDSTDLLEKQDLAIARQVEEEGRALLIAVNKWDLVEDKQAALRKLADRLEISLPQCRGLKVIPLSARTGRLRGRAFRQHR